MEVIKRYIGPEVLSAPPGTYVMGWLNYPTDIAEGNLPDGETISWNGAVAWSYIKASVTKRTLYHVFIGPLPALRKDVIS